LINNYKLKFVITKNKRLKWDARCDNEEGTEKKRKLQNAKDRKTAKCHIHVEIPSIHQPFSYKKISFLGVLF
jgi:hypothetical protein